MASNLDDFSRRRLAELPSIGDLRRQAQHVEWMYLAGALLSTYSRRDLDILRATGILSIRELQHLGRLDATFAEHAALDGVSDLGHCAHCGRDLTARHKIVEVDVLGVTRRYHTGTAYGPCANAARWLTIGNRPPPPVDGGDVVPIRGAG